jgi:L-lactate dehydrogenase
VQEHPPVRVAVVGAGNVGATFAYALLLSGLASEIVLIDRNAERAEGEAMDLAHAVPFSRPTRIWSGDYDDCATAAVTVVTAGVGQRPGESRLDLARRNVEVFGDIVPRIARVRPDGILLVTTNPVDVLTKVALDLSGMPPNRVIGSGTTLDTGRFRAALGDLYRVDPRSVHAFIIGEHGDSEVPVWSLANIAGVRLDELPSPVEGLDPGLARADVFETTRDAAYRIIERKGATFYAVAAALVRIVEAILRDQRTVLSVSSLVDGMYGIRDVCLSLPSVVGRGGVEEVLPLSLSPDEEAALRRSATLLRETLDAVTGS